MNLSIDSLLKNLNTNLQSILLAIDLDPFLSKRVCPKTGLVIANASKELFTPTKEHQLYAKGIVYKRILNWDERETTYELVSLPYLKIYNYGENQWANKHVSDMLTKEVLGYGLSARYTVKYDGTMIQRFVYNGEVYFATRGMIETMVAPDDENSRFFKWTREIAEKKYPALLEPNVYVQDSTLLFELVGPENRIITKYDDWDLLLTGVSDVGSFEYLGRYHLQNVSDDFNLSLADEYIFDGNMSIEETAKNLNTSLLDSDEEGTVVSFEDIHGLNVYGRIKIKTESYRRLLKLFRNCDMKSVAAMLRGMERYYSTWEVFEGDLKLQGNDLFPEELMDQYRQLYDRHMNYYRWCTKFVLNIQGLTCSIIDKHRIPFDYGPDGEIVMDKAAKKKFAEHANQTMYPGAVFAYVNNKLDVQWVMDKISMPESSENPPAAQPGTKEDRT